MNLLSPFVLGAAGVCASPALYAALTGGMPMEVAMSRYLVALGICWVALSAVAALIGEPPAPARQARPGPCTEVGRIWSRTASLVRSSQRPRRRRLRG